MERDEFLKRVETHKMEILLDEENYKHILFQKPDTTDQYFTLMFYPGYCVFGGDMGEWVFSRVPDMMNFFRGDKISPVYWAEKCKATSRFGRGDSSDDFYNFDMEAYKKFVWEYVDEWIEGHGDAVSVADAAVLKDLIRSEIIEPAVEYYNEFNALRLLNENSIRVNNALIFSFSDPFEHKFQEFTGYFLFACHAIQWGISQYDQFKAENPITAADYYYDKDDWEYTYTGPGELYDQVSDEDNGILEVGMLNCAGTMFLAEIEKDIDEEGEVFFTEVEQFKTREEAEAAQKVAHEALAEKYPDLIGIAVK